MGLIERSLRKRILQALGSSPIVLERPDGKLAGIETKGRDAVNDDDFKGLKELRRQVDDDLVCGIVLYRGNSVVPFDERMWAVPVSAMWQ